MNWERFQTYGQSSEKSFEMLCNQLFENWCKEECKDTQSAIDKCSYSSQEYGHIQYYMPSATLRTLLGITDTNGYQYYNNCNSHYILAVFLIYSFHDRHSPVPVIFLKQGDMD